MSENEYNRIENDMVDEWKYVEGVEYETAIFVGNKWLILMRMNLENLLSESQ